MERSCTCCATSRTATACRVTSKLWTQAKLGPAIGNKTGALNQVRNDVALIATKTGPVVIAAFTWDNEDQRWTGDNEAEKTLGKLAQAIVERWSPAGLDAASFPWTNPLAPPASPSSH